MRRLALMALLYLLVGICEATFEIEDPSKIVQQDIDEATAKMEAAEAGTATKTPADEKLIVPVGSYLYRPNIVSGRCTGWDFDKSETGSGDNNIKYYATQTTYMGVAIKQIDCRNNTDDSTLGIVLIRIEKGRLIWVRQDRLLSAE